MIFSTLYLSVPYVSTLECSFLVFHGLLLVSHSLGEYKVSGKTFTNGAIEAGIISVLIAVGNMMILFQINDLWGQYFME